MGQKAGALAGEAREQAGVAVDKARDQATRRLDAQMNRAASGLQSMAKALNQASSNLRQEDHDELAQMVDMAANRLDSMSGYFREHDLNDVVGEVEQFARNRPAIFLGGALTLGFLASRFLKSSSEDARESGRRAPIRGRETGYLPGYGEETMRTTPTQMPYQSPEQFGPTRRMPHGQGEA